VQQARANKAKGGQKNKFVDPNNNLQELEGENQTTQSTITTTQSNPDDKWLEDEDKGGFIFSQNTNQNAKPQKKKPAPTVQPVGWEALNKEKEPEKEQEKPLPEPVENVVKKKVMKLPRAGESKKTDLNIAEEYFPTLGEEINPELHKPKPVERERKENTASSAEKKPSGPMKFVNAKKADTPEKSVQQSQPVPQGISSFSEKPTTHASEKPTTSFERPTTHASEKPTTSFERPTTHASEKPTTSFERPTTYTTSTTTFERGTGTTHASEKPTTSFERPTTYTPSTTSSSSQPILRNTNPVVSKETAQSEAAKVEDSKFKFASDKPRFMNAKVGSETKKKEVVKSEAELLQEAKDRDMEEKLFKEREEARKRAEENKARKALRNETGEHKPETTTTEETAQESKDKSEAKDKFEAKERSDAKDKSERKGFSNTKRIERAEPTEDKKRIELTEERKIDDPNSGFTDIKLVRKNPKPRKEVENGEKKEKKEKKIKAPKVEEHEPVAKEEDVKEEKVVPAHEVIALNTNVTAASWEAGGVLKKVSKKKA